MAVAEIIGAAIGILLLVAVAYLLVGGTLSTAEIVVNAQKDVALQSEVRLKTDISMIKSDMSITGSGPKGLNFSITNTGNEIISDFEHTDVYTYNNIDNGYQHYRYDKYKTGNAGNWTVLRIDNDYIHPNQLDPGEKAWIMATFSGTNPVWVQFATNNGVYAQTTFP
jgi:archaeal flagellar protein FlaF